MSPTLSLSLFILWLSIRGSFAAEPTVLFSSNVTSLEVGQSAKLTCQLDNFEPGTYESYYVTFYRDNDDDFGSYSISAPDPSGQRITQFYNETSTQPSLGRQPLSSVFPVYEITVTPTLAATKQYYCRLLQSSLIVDVYSKHLSITVTPPLPPSVPLT